MNFLSICNSKFILSISHYSFPDTLGDILLQEKIIELLNEKNETLGGDIVAGSDGKIEAIRPDFSKVGSPETYLGYSRIEYLANLPNSECADVVCTYVRSESVTLNTYVLDGGWNIREEQATLASEEGSIIIRFSANKVNLVAGSGGDIKALIYLDGELIDTSFAGSDVDGSGAVLFERYGLYNLVDLGGEYGEHELEIKFINPGIEAFAFTYG